MESDSQHSSPILRVTTDISELKDSNEYLRHSCSKSMSRDNLSGNGTSRKKTLHPIHGCTPYQGRNNFCGSYHVNLQNAKSNVSTFTQRIMSAKLLRVKQLQNQLAESQSKINELITENKLLKTLQRRQDNALRKYEGSQEQLPQLIKSHNEEIRVINAKFKQLKLNYRVLENKLKERDSELMNLKEQHKHLLKLSRDKQLFDREKLTKKLEEMEIRSKSQQEKIEMLTRKIELEGKSHRHRLNLEISKHKETQAELRDARKTIDNLRSSLEGRPKFVNTNLPKKILRPFPDLNAQSRISLPAPPPNVSIRQPQRLVQSETAITRDEETDSDSFSFGLQNMPQNVADDSCSDRSDSDEEERSNDIERVNKKSRNAQIESCKSVNKLNNGRASVTISSANSCNNLRKSSISLMRLSSVQPKNVERSVTKAGSLEDKFPVSYEERIKSENKIKNMDALKNDVEIKSPLVRNASRRNSLSTVKPLIRNQNNSTVERRPSTNAKTFAKSHSLESIKSNSFEKSNQNESNVSEATNSPLLEASFDANKYTLDFSEMHSELERKLDKFMYKQEKEEHVTILSNDNIANFVDAEIEKLERKFKIFDMPQIRKEAEDDINRIVDRACMNMTGGDINHETPANNSEKFQPHCSNIEITNKEYEDDGFLVKLENCYKEVENPQPDIMLGDSQKANLLKALNNIDNESDTNLISNCFQDSDENYNRSSFQKLQRFPHVGGNLINSRAKSEVIKELFSEESTTVSSK